jgi:hypothetical protein
MLLRPLTSVIRVCLGKSQVLAKEPELRNVFLTRARIAKPQSFFASERGNLDSPQLVYKSINASIGRDELIEGVAWRIYAKLPQTD